MLGIQYRSQMRMHQMQRQQNTMNFQDNQLQMQNVNKQSLKKQRLTTTNIMIAILLFCIIVMLGFYMYTFVLPAKTQSKIDLTHNKYLQMAQSSTGKQTSSNSGSQSSKTTRDSSKPIGVAQTAGKTTISSNIQQSGSGGDDEDPSQDDNDGEKRKKHLAKNSKDGVSTEGFSSDEEEDEEDEDSDSGVNDRQISVWPRGGRSENMPLIGKSRT